MLGKIKLFLRCVDYSLSILIVVCCLVFGSWWFSAESYSYEEGVYPREEFCQDICQIYSDIALLSQKRGDWNTAIETYNTALEAIFKTKTNLLDIHPKKEFVRFLLPIYDGLELCYQKLGEKEKALKTHNRLLTLN